MMALNLQQAGDTSALSLCLLVTLCPCTTCASINIVNEREELVVLQWGKFGGVIKNPGFTWINCVRIT